MRSITAVCIWLFVALSTFQQIKAQSPTDALQLQGQGDWSKAETVWRALIEANPQDDRYWGSLGACLAHQNRYDEAIQAYKRALVLKPGEPQSELNLGLAYFKLGRLNKAIPPLKAAAASFPADRQVDLLLGMSLYGTGRYREALPYLEPIADREQNNPQLQLVLARSYLLSGLYEKARDQFKAMLVRDENSPSVHMLLGEAYDGLGKTDEALAEFRAAAQSNAPDAHFSIGYLLWRDKHYNEAADEFRKELANNSGQYEALAYLGDCLLKQGDVDQASQYLHRSISQKDVLWITHYDLGIIAADQKNYPKAITELQRAANLNSKRAEVHYRLAQAYKAVGNGTKAQAELRAVSRLHEQRNQDLILKVHGALH
jgi:tetratricopeptide (TPR) repeat protein